MKINRAVVLGAPTRSPRRPGVEEPHRWPRKTPASEDPLDPLMTTPGYTSPSPPGEVSAHLRTPCDLRWPERLAERQRRRRQAEVVEDRTHRRGLLDERQHHEPTAAARALPQFARSHASAPRTQGGRATRARRSVAARGRARCSRAPRRGTWPGARAPPGAAPFPPPSAAASLRQGAKTQRHSTAPTLVRRRRPSPPRPPRGSCAARRATKIRAARRRLRGQIRAHARDTARRVGDEGGSAEAPTGQDTTPRDRPLRRRRCRREVPPREGPNRKARRRTHARPRLVSRAP